MVYINKRSLVVIFGTKMYGSHVKLVVTTVTQTSLTQGLSVSGETSTNLRKGFGRSLNCSSLGLEEETCLR